MGSEINEDGALLDESEVEVALLHLPLSSADVFLAPDLVELEFAVVDQVVVQVLVLQIFLRADVGGVGLF